MNKFLLFLTLCLGSITTQAQVFDMPDYSYCSQSESLRCESELKSKVDVILPKLIDSVKALNKNPVECLPKWEFRSGRNVFICRQASEKFAKIVINTGCICYMGKLISNDVGLVKIRFF